MRVAHTWSLEDTAWDSRAMSRGRRRQNVKVCQVPGCGEVLDAGKLRPYNLRYKLCMLHLRAECVDYAGVPMRFCQKCSRFHPLSAFEATKHTCTLMLQRHNRRRRVGAKGRSEEEEEEDSRSAGSSERDAPSAQASGARGAPTRVSRADVRSETGRAAASTARGASNAAARLYRPSPAAAAVKLPPPPPLPSLEMVDWDNFINDEGMQTLFRDLPASGDPSISTGAFAAALLGYAPGPPPPPVLQPQPQLQQQPAVPTWAAPPPAAAAVAPPAAAAVPIAVTTLPTGPGLVLPLPPSGDLGGPPQPAAAAALLQTVVTHIKMHELSPAQLPPQVAQAVRAWLGPAVLDALSYVRPGCTLLEVHALTWRDAPVGAAGPAALKAALGAAGAAGGIDVSTSVGVASTPLPPLRPAAVCSAAASSMALASAAPAAADGVLRAFCCGRTLALQARAQRGRSVALRLPPAAAGLEGLLMVQLEEDGNGSESGSGSGNEYGFRPVLLTRDAAVAAEVAAALDRCDDVAEAEGCVLALGHALTAGAPAAVVRLAARLAAARGWGATLAHLRALLAASGPTPAGEDTALHAAAASGDASRAQLARDMLGDAAGNASSTGAHGITPLHIAAAIASGCARAAMLRELCTSHDDGKAPIAWLSARDARGDTPAQLVAAQPGAHAATGALDAELRVRLAEAAVRARAALRQARDCDGYFVAELACEVAADRLAAEGDADAAAMLRATLQLPYLESTDLTATSSLAWRGVRWPRLPAWLRMPGSFADAEVEAAWLHETATHRRLLDAHAYAFSALIHLLEFARAVAAGDEAGAGARHTLARGALQLLYCLLLLLLLPALARRAPGWYVPRREAVISAVRLGAAWAAPLWLTAQPAQSWVAHSDGACHPRSLRADAFAAVITGGWLGRLPLLALPVRWPLQAAVSLGSFALVLPRGVTGAVRVRSWATALNAAVVLAFERSSRAHFAAARAAAGAKAGKLE